MKKQYLVMAQHGYQVAEGRWTNVRRTHDSHSYYLTKKEAQDALRKYIKQWNAEHTYDANGKRRETDDLGGGFAADLIISRALDDENRVVAWKIKVRQVTEWDEVESGEI